MDGRMRLVFTTSTINPFTGKRLREWRKDGINGFIAECYTEKTAKNNKFIADHCISYCEKCGNQHSIFGLGNTPSAAYNDCIKELNNFKCDNS